MDNIYIFLYHNDYIKYDIHLPINIINHSKKYSDLDFNISISNYYYLNSKLEKLFNSSLKELYFDEFDKPHIPNIYISLAHTHNLFGFVICTTQDIAIDIEAINRFSNFKHINTILNDLEYQEYIKSSAKSEYLANKWTTIEALSKLEGTGLNKSTLKKRPNHYKNFVLNNSSVSIVSNKPIKNNIKLFIDEKEIN